ncbi:MAG: biopolymer transporter ExbD [Burkholderiales bacterium]|nr:biopolymer transporter ExbD [Burkholderiales bacterium]
MKTSPLQRRAERRARNQSLVDLNLVSLIDVFTILIFFLLSSATEVQTLPSAGAVKLPAARSEQAPRPALELVVSPTQILLQGRPVASVADALAGPELIAPLQAALAAAVAVAAGGSAPAPQAVTLLGDKDIPYHLLRRILRTCAAAQLAEVSFAVRPKDEA